MDSFDLKNLNSEFLKDYTMKILTRSQIREADIQTIEKEPIAAIDLMERAAKACYEWIISRYDITRKFIFLCYM